MIKTSIEVICMVENIGIIASMDYSNLYMTV